MGHKWKVSTMESYSTVYNCYVLITVVKSVTNWEFVLEENEMPKVLGSGTYGTVSKII